MALVWVFYLISGFVSRLTLSDNRHSLFPVFLAQYVFITLHRGKKSPQLLSSLVDPEVFFFFRFVFIREILRFMFMFATRRHFCQNLFGISGFGNIENNVTTFL